jgi:hypothetical protein
MRVGAAEAEGIHTDNQSATRSQRPIGSDDIQVPLAEWNLRIGIVHADVRRDDPVTQRVQCFDESGNARCGFQMPDIALD